LLIKYILKLSIIDFTLILVAFITLSYTNHMKKIKSSIALFMAACLLSSCATVFAGKVNAYQRTKPAPGQQQRQLRVGAFIADILLFWPGTIIDFATCAIYKPTPAEESKQDTPVPAAK
jgi:hypothetical protein